MKMARLVLTQVKDSADALVAAEPAGIVVSALCADSFGPPSRRYSKNPLKT